ncbi:hypothetical protein SAMN05421753_11227 [Planctomicrobium piriforme]|uniref:Uncharacterized protein n=1 Tax=Planctomicrobium piriforme TaxID=1576369 RepID=A0A1I3KRZ7_9PLAN|nr:hypothetical protein SAMN05421753_11227 [Planctomicrobium piriforme]
MTSCILKSFIRFSEDLENFWNGLGSGQQSPHLLNFRLFNQGKKCSSL